MINFLKICAFKGVIAEYRYDEDENNQEHELTVDINDQFEISTRVTNKKERFYQDFRFRLPVNIMYLTVVLTCLLWPCVCTVVETVRLQNTVFLTTNIMNFLPFVQYLVGVVYHRTDHFFRTTRRSTDYKNVVFAGLVVGGVLSFMSTVLLLTGVNLGLYTDIFNRLNVFDKGLFVLLFVLTKFYSYSVFFTNLTVFTTVFLIHSSEIQEYSYRLECSVNSNEQGLTIESITKDYSEQKSTYAESVKKLNSMFTSITILGLVSIYYVVLHIDSEYINFYSYFDICCFLITDGAYIFFISMIKNNISTIQSTINTDRFISRFLSRATLEHLRTVNIDKIENTVGDTDESNSINLIKDVVIRTMIKGHENAECIDWLILNNKLGSSWESFKFLGFDMDDSSLAKKIVASVTGLFMVIELNSTLNV